LSTQPLVDGVSGTVEGVKFNAGNGINNPNSNGLVSIDATGFKGNLGLDITNAVGGHNDPSSSGKQFFTTITGGDGNDVFYTGNSITGTSTLHDVLNGGAGNNKLVDYAASIDKNAQISNIQSLEVRDQGAGPQTVDFKAFTDAGPSSVLMRNEDSALGASAFTLQNIDPTLASNGGLILNHGTTASEGAKNGKDTVSDMVTVQLADATGASDTVALTVNPDKNTTTTFDYTLDTTAMTNATTGKANGTVENASVTDNDAESNVLTLNNINDHTGTVTLSGGSKGTSYTVKGGAATDGLLATTVDASGQASNLFLTAKPVDPTTGAAINQTVKLGTGDDVLTYGNAALGDGALNLLTSNDVVTDAGGNDVVSAVFSKDFGALKISNVETLQIASTANAKGDLSSATGITTLNLLSDQATNGVSKWDQFGLATPVIDTAIITLANTNLSTLNFAGQNDNNNLLPGTLGGGKDDGNPGENLAQVFNGVTLSNNASANLTVNINSRAVGNDSLTHQEAGATSYSTGQLTTHGVTDMTIAVGDELAINKGDTRSATMTSINNVFDKNLSSLTVTAQGSVNLGTISGNATNNNMTLLDATKVLGNFAATNIALGDAAQVKIGNGGTDDAANTLVKGVQQYTTFSGSGFAGDVVKFNNVYGFDALGSAGGVVTPVTITAGNGIDVIRGTAQNDIITTGAGNDIVNGDNGNNVISTGAGDDNVAVGHGNNTISLGSGTAEAVTVNLATKLDDTLNTTAVTGNGTAARIAIDADGKGVDGGALGFMDGKDALGAVSFDNYIAVGDGHDLGIRWTGNTIQLKSSTLDGVIAKATGTAFTAGSSVLHVGDLAGAAADYSKAGAVVLLDYGTDGTAGTVGGSVITGSSGNDAIVVTGDAIAADTITGGAGADRIVLGAGGHGGKADKLIVNDNDSLATAFDQVTNFATAQDLLHLQTVNIDASFAKATDTGIILSNGNHLFITGENAGGLLTFADAAVGGNVVIAGTSTANVHNQLEVNGTDLMAWLQGHTTALSTTVFTYDHAGVGAATDSIVYQSTPHGTAVELVGVVAGAGVTVAGADFTVA
ncbi:MAG: hypothetical protein KGN35_02270, partial [Betaproteobacteria bacterium]|nr:hypothetical protein [Betaproteobacteria bacterium]